MGSKIDLTGQRFGYLRVLGEAPVRNRTHITWACICDCGVEKCISGPELRAGQTRSCGCMTSKMTADKNRTHGQSGTRLYGVWGAMIKRCTPHHERAKDYFERGITVCERWKKFENFYADMGATWRPRLTIERVDNDKGYEPGNCVWATYHVQGNNKRNNHVIETPKGEMTIAQAARAFGIHYKTLRARIDRGETDILRETGLGLASRR